MADTKKVEVEVSAISTTKPGYKTTEFWLNSVAVIVGLLMSSGVVADGTSASRIVGGVVTVLAALGYTASRSNVKKTLK